MTRHECCIIIVVVVFFNTLVLKLLECYLKKNLAFRIIIGCFLKNKCLDENVFFMKNKEHVNEKAC